MNYKCLSRNALKLIAMICMVVDHVALFFVPSNNIAYLLMRIVGRISFPLFAFFLAQGYIYSKNRLKYFCYILVFGLISQIPYSLLLGFNINILLTFILAFILIFVYEKTIEKNKFGKFAGVTLFATTSIVFILVSFFLPFDYSFLGVLTPLVFYIFRKNHYSGCLAYLILLVIQLVISLAVISFQNIIFLYFVQLFSILYIIPLSFYNGKNGKTNLKYMFYFFYPIHLLIIYVLFAI